MSVLVLVLVLGACKGGADPELPPYGGWPLWTDVDESAAVDLGHTPVDLGGAEAGPLVFEDVTLEVGLGQAAGGGNQHGVGLALVDLDGDERPELFIANGVGNRSNERTPSQLWHNLGDGTFEDVTDASGVADILRGTDLYAVASADIDADGDLDLYVAGQPTNVLLRNRGDGTFEDGTAASDLAGPPSDPQLVADGRGKLVAFGDHDSDGDPDVIIATSTMDRPGAALLVNDGSGRFADESKGSGVRIASDGNPCALMWTDYDNDGTADAWIWNDRGGHLLLHGTDDGFEDFGNRADKVSIRNPMGIDGADIDRDGDLDYYVSNIGRHPLLQNNGDGTFTDITEAAGTFGEFGWGLAFEDLDLDGHVDLVVAQEDTLPILVFRNRGDGTFTQSELARPVPQDAGDAHNVPAAFADVDGDGRVDFVTSNTDGTRVALHRNVTDVGGHHALEVRVVTEPETSRRGGIGARVVVEIGDELQFRDLTGGSSRASQNEVSVRFGLGTWDGADRVSVVWPDGRQWVATNVPAGVLRVE